MLSPLRVDVTPLSASIFGDPGQAGHKERRPVELVSRRALQPSDPSLDRTFREHLRALDPSPERCVIINVRTEVLTAKAADSARRFGARDILLINCDPTERSREELRRVAERTRSALLEAPVRRHGAMLDVLFTHLQDDVILLLDSDAELRSDVPNRIRAEIGAPEVYGSGWIHGPNWLPGVFGNAGKKSIRTGWYLERPWIPCALLKRPLIAEAINAGASFREGVLPNDIPALPALNRLLLFRFYVPGLRRLRLTALERARRDYDSVRPNYCYADTGALLHQALLRRGMRFAGPPAPLNNPDVAHQHGATRLVLGIP